MLTSLWDLFFFFCFLFQFDVIFGYNWRSQKRKQQARDFILFVFFNVIGIREVASSDTKFFFSLDKVSLICTRLRKYGKRDGT